MHTNGITIKILVRNEAPMSTTITVKGQVTIPKQIRDSLGLVAGARIEFAVNRDGEVVLHPIATGTKHKPNRFEAARGKADVKWRTKDLMSLLRDPVA
jgi:antitoxin PrlF